MTTQSYTGRRLSVALLCALALSTVLGLPVAHAVVVHDLYGAEVTVPSQSRADREAGTREALQTVLIRVSGDTTVAGKEPIDTALKHAVSYLNRYSYRRQTAAEAEADAQARREAAASTSPADSAASAGAPAATAPAPSASANPDGAAAPVVTAPPPPRGYVLTLEFRADAVNQLLRQSGEPMWSSNRPGILAWVEVDGSAGSYLIRADSPPVDAQALRTAMRRRGLPLILPTAAPDVDLFDAVGEGRYAVIDTASAGYGADAVLVGKVGEQWQGRWQGVWTLRDGGAVQRWQFERDSREAVVNAAVDALADRLARRYAMVGDASGKLALLLRVDDVDAFDDYSDLLLYLQHLPMIDSVGVASVKRGTIRLRLVSSADLPRLADMLALQKHLQSVAPSLPSQPVAAAPTAVARADLHYRWVH